MATKVIAAQGPSRLRADCLNFWEVWAQAIAVISPTMTAALIVPTMFGAAGAGSWLAYLFGTVMLLFVALNLNHFARRSTSAGSMYAYTSRGLGPTAGGVAGWCLIWAYLFIGVAGLTGFANFANVLLAMAHIHIPLTILFGACALIAWYVSFKDIKISTILMLVLEGVSVALILALTAIVLFKHGAPVDHAQLSLHGMKPATLGLGVVIAIFSLVGFESATWKRRTAGSPCLPASRPRKRWRSRKVGWEASIGRQDRSKGVCGSRAGAPPFGCRGGPDAAPGIMLDMRRIWALADTHLSFAKPKPMDIFGEHWRDHPARIEAACRAIVAPDDLLLMPGDLSWAMKRADAEPDLAWLAALPGVKVLCKGNHDYWWDSDKSLDFPGLHDTPFVSEDGRVGVAGTRGWFPAAGTDAEKAKTEKIIAREVVRLTRRLEGIEGCALKIALIHYPPLDVFAPILTAHGVKTVLYGHLHLNGRDYPVPERWYDLRALCVAADRLHFTPRLVATLD